VTNGQGEKTPFASPRGKKKKNGREGGGERVTINGAFVAWGNQKKSATPLERKKGKSHSARGGRKTSENKLTLVRGREKQGGGAELNSQFAS